MCGICGIYVYDDSAEKVDKSELINIRDYMSKRGPDDMGLWINKNERIGLAHRRLSILDLSEAGNQPMISNDKRFIIVFNGEIYNYQELRLELEKKGYIFKSYSDTEVLLNLYADYGKDMLLKLRGMFALAIWDNKNHSLFLARDQFGIKPLYYYNDGKSIKFASQVKALLAGRRINSNLDPAGNVGFFIWGSIPEPYTLYKEIKALPAGCYLWIENSRFSDVTSYYTIQESFTKSNIAKEKFNPHEKQQRLCEALADSIKHHMIADVPVGVFLSAGKDSCALTSLASQTSFKQLRTLTLGFNEYRGSEKDETIIAECLAKEYGTDHSTMWVSLNDFEGELDALMRAMDQPSIDGVNTYFVSKVASQSGLKVALSGLGGDEMFLGYGLFKQIPNMLKYLSFTRMFPKLCKDFTLITSDIIKRHTNPKYAGLFEYGNNLNGAYLLRRSLFMPWELTEFLDADLVREGWGNLKYTESLDNIYVGIKDLQRKLQVLEYNYYMRNQLLRDADWASMAHSLEIRVPLVDVKLLETVIELSDDGNSLTKQEMVSALNRKLPEYIINREKTGFNVPVSEWLLKSMNPNSVQKSYGLRAWAKEVYKYQTTSRII